MFQAYECVPCKKSYQKYSAYWTHATIEHNQKEKPQPQHCNYEGCGKIFSTSGTLKQHYEYIHLGKPRSLEQVCETCGKTFTNIYQLKVIVVFCVKARSFLNYIPILIF